MPHFDGKLIIIGALFVALILVKLLAGNRPYDRPVRRTRRFGHRGTMSPLRRAEQGLPPEPPLKAVEPEEPPRDPEKEFFGE